MISPEDEHLIFQKAFINLGPHNLQSPLHAPVKADNSSRDGQVPILNASTAVLRRL